MRAVPKYQKGGLILTEKMKEQLGVRGIALVEIKKGKAIVSLAVARAFGLKVIESAPTLKELESKLVRASAQKQLQECEERQADIRECWTELKREE